MEAPQELSIVEIRKYMLENGCRVTNHALVKHFKRFLTDPSTQNEARKQFKTYVNVLATIKNENNQKFLILRKKYINECPSDEVAERAIAVGDAVPGSPGGASLLSEGGQASPFRQPPPYKPPPEVSASKVIPAPPPMQPTTGTVVQKENVENYRDCVKEFAAAVQKIDPSRLVKQSSEDAAGLGKQTSEMKETNKSQKNPKSISRENSTGTSENIPRFSFSSGTSGGSAESSCADKVSSSDGDVADNPISVKEATRKFNRMASEEESKIISPPAKKKAEQQLIEEKVSPEVLLAHPKSKEWIVSMAKASYQELAKLANEFPELVKLQDPSTGYTALHWAAKHGNEDVVKLIAGTYKADVNARTNGGYTPLHLAMQFGRENIFELLCNVYKANRDLMDWSGNKPLDYLKQRTSVSLTTYSKIKARRKHTAEKDLGFLRIGSLNVRVKKTTEAFSNFLGVGNGNGNTNNLLAPTANHHPQRHHRHHHHAGMTKNHHTHPRTMNTPLGMTSRHHQLVHQNTRASVPIRSSNNKYDTQIHKSWGSADNIPHTGCETNTKEIMPPPKRMEHIKNRQQSSQRSSIASNTTDRDSVSSSNSSSNLNSGYSSMPTTPNQLRAPIGVGMPVKGQLLDSDSDSACGFGSNWSVGGRSSVSCGNFKDPKYV